MEKVESGPVSVVVVIKGEQIADTKKVAAALREEGMVIDGVLSGYGAVVGQAATQQISQLAKVEGVERIETEDVAAAVEGLAKSTDKPARALG